MKEIDKDTPLTKLTVGEFMSLYETRKGDKRYEFGIKGIAKIFGCSRSKAQQIKASGIIDKAIIQNGKIIIVDKEEALRLFNENPKSK